MRTPIHIDDVKSSKKFKFEDDQYIEGNLILAFSFWIRLPKGLEVQESLDLKDSKVRSLPRRLKIGGWLDMTDTEIKTLPNDLNVCGTLFCTHLI